MANLLTVIPYGEEYYYNDTCLGFVENESGIYYLQSDISINIEEIKPFINGIVKSFEGLKITYHRTKNFYNICYNNGDDYIDEDYREGNEEDLKLVHVFEIDNSEFDASPSRFRLFINQIIRYMLESETKPVVMTTIDLMKKFPTYPFWNLFHVANIISNKNLDDYFQPFISLTEQCVYDIDKIEERISDRGSIVNATTYSSIIDKKLIKNIIENYKKGDIKKLHKNLDELFSFNPEALLCINNLFTKHLTKNKKYVIQNSNKNNYFIINDDFRVTGYKKERFELIKE